MFLELNGAEYEKVLQKAIEATLKDYPQIIPYFVKLIPMFKTVFEASLYIPAINENMIRESLQAQRDHIEKTYADEVATVTNKRNADLREVDITEEKLNKIIEKHPVTLKRQK